jgi:hypothetical protein
MSDFALSNDHAMLLQGRGSPKIYPADSGPVLQGGGTRNNTVYGEGNFCAQIQKNDVAVPMSMPSCLQNIFIYLNLQAIYNLHKMRAGADTRLFSAEEYAGTESVSVRPQDDHRNRGNDLLLFDWPELSPLEDFETSLR